MKPAIFIDTGYILGLVNTADQYHEQARQTASLVKAPFLTTEAVLTEIGNTFSRVRWRQLGVVTLKALRADPHIEIISVSATLFEQAVTLYASRPDKAWGLTDCISFVVMETRSLRQVLTTDRHFEQAGFQNLLVDA